MKILGALLVLAFVPSSAACGGTTPSLTTPEPPTDAGSVGPAEAEESEQWWGTLIVSVTDANGTPRANVPLGLTGLGNGNTAPDWESAPVTGPDGTVELTNLLGPFEVATILEGAQNDSAEVEITAGSTAGVDLVIPD
ncbi:hypothetical protein AB0K52_08900 [Glycomyces sp. NPDC049804]|uniref:hypothetical protein n=1 Tax=Glycomyces sp. NPDC049804 TaxID=3154363 RepID=UPI00344163C7